MDFGDALPASSRQFVHAKAIVIGGQAREVTFSVIDDREKLKAACNLLNDRYAWRGYGAAHSIKSDAHHTTFTAEVDGAVVGTITLAMDSSQGLAIDHTFETEAKQVRQDGARICELTKLAFDSSFSSKEVLAGLFHIAFIYGTNISDCTDLFIEVNPRHSSFYETMLGFAPVGAVRTNASVAAPSQLMRLNIDALCQAIREMAGRASTGSAPTRSLYPYFFSRSDESKIRRLLLLNQKRQELGLSATYAQGRDHSEAPGERANPLDAVGGADPTALSGSVNIAGKTNEQIRHAA